jgi:hypothetical protein
VEADILVGELAATAELRTRLEEIGSTVMAWYLIADYLTYRQREPLH